jgi:glycine betaine/choline ABC-type transport system substrate-binding protein
LAKVSRAAVAAVLPLLAIGCGRSDSIIVGSKNFSESILLGEIVAQQLERHGFPVERKFNLGGFLCHEGMLTGQLDTYVEYTGTAYAAVLKLPPERDPVRVRQAVDSIYRERFGIIWTEDLGFANTFAILVRRRDAERLGLKTISDAVPHMRRWRAVFGYEFTERADGFRALAEAYGIRMERQPVNMELGLVYRALADGAGDFSSGNSTDGQIEALDLVILEDDKRFFPPYDAAPVVRAETLERYPQAREALRALGGRIDGATMRRLNYRVDVEQRPVTEVAREFLAGIAK